MVRIAMLLGLFIGCLPYGGIAQLSQTSTLSLSIGAFAPNLSLESPHSLSSPSLTASRLPTELDILPQYAKDNPANYSFLCQLEVDIEEKSPIGVWFKIDQTDPLLLSQSRGGKMPYVRLKMNVFD